MMALLRLPRFVPFVVFNGAALALLTLLFLAPLLSHFASRSEEISESGVQLAHLHSVIRDAQAQQKRARAGTQPFLTGSEERVVSADLQANLQALATAKGARVLGLRGLQSGQIARLRTVAVGLEVEAPLGILRDLMSEIESQTPFLFITEASLRALVDGDDGVIHADLKIEGVVRELRSPTRTPLATEARVRSEIAGATGPE